jgi:predicted Zn-ribbon and HTH transcriptional regulator
MEQSYGTKSSSPRNHKRTRRSLKLTKIAVCVKCGYTFDPATNKYDYKYSPSPKLPDKCSKCGSQMKHKTVIRR